MNNLANVNGQIKADRTPFLKFYTGDWLSGTLGMGFEEKGFYLECLIRMWDRKDGLPNDDRWLATSLQCNPRTVRKLRASLVASGKLEIRDGKLVNPRMMRDIESHSGKHHSDRIQPELGSNSDRIELELKPNAAEKPIKSMAEKTPIFHIPEDRKKEKNTAVHSEQDSARPSEPEPDGWRELKTLFNGSTEAMLADVARWMGPLARRQDAVNWLTGTVAAFGSSRTAQAWTMITTKMARNEVIPSPLPLWAKTARGLSPDAAAPAKQDRSGMVFMPSRYGNGKWVPRADGGSA